MSDLRVGIAGFGVVGKRRKNCIVSHPRLRVVAVCDRTFADEGVLADGVRLLPRLPAFIDREFGRAVRLFDQ